MMIIRSLSSNKLGDKGYVKAAAIWWPPGIYTYIYIIYPINNSMIIELIIFLL